jgi:hypothetical protein
MSIDHESAPVVTAPEAGTPTGRMVRFGSRNGLVERGQLVGKVDEMPVVVLWADGRAWAIEDRCPHMGFPLHRGTVADGLPASTSPPAARSTCGPMTPPAST